MFSVVSSNLFTVESNNFSADYQQTNIVLQRSIIPPYTGSDPLFIPFKLVPRGTNRPIKITDSAGQIEFGYRIKLTSARFTTGLCAITELKRDGSL